MLIDLLLQAIILIVLLISAYSDIKTREIPDWLNFSFIAAALGIRAIYSISEGFSILISGLLGFVICFGIAYLFYYTNQWGGGDSKLLMGVGAAIGVSYPFSGDSLQLLWFFLGLLFFGALWGLIWMVGISIKKKSLFKKRFKSILQKHNLIHLIIWIFTLLFIIVTLFFNHFWVMIIFPSLIFYLFIFVSSVEKSCFFVRKEPKDLTEGDWLAENLIIDGKKIISKKTLVEKDLNLLNNLKHKKKIFSVLIKEGIPFTPAFLISYVVIIFFHENILILLNSLF